MRPVSVARLLQGGVAFSAIGEGFKWKKKVIDEGAARTALDPRRVAFERIFERHIETLRADARLLVILTNPSNYSYGPENAERLGNELTLLAWTTVNAFEKYLPKQDLLRSKHRVRV